MTFADEEKLGELPNAATTRSTTFSEGTMMPNKKQPNRGPNLIEYQGRVLDLNQRIGPAKFGTNSIRFDWIDDDGDVLDTIRLSSRDGINYEGETDPPHDQRKRGPARVTGTLYSNQNGHVLLAKFIEDDGDEAEYVLEFFDGKEVPLA